MTSLLGIHDMTLASAVSSGKLSKVVPRRNPVSSLPFDGAPTLLSKTLTEESGIANLEGLPALAAVSRILVLKVAAIATFHFDNGCTLKRVCSKSFLQALCRGL